jgi:hypothetical protein
MPTMGDDAKQIRSFATAYAVIAFLILESLVVAQALLAYQDRFLTVAEMQSRGVREGLPFVAHLGMWCDLLLISGLSAYLISRYAHTWKLRWASLSLLAGILSASVMSYLYTYSSVPETHIQNHGLTIAGYVHLTYMALTIAVFTQFLLFTETASLRIIRIVCALLFIHVIFGTHMVLGAIKLIQPLDWYPIQPLNSPFGWVTVGFVGLVLAVCSFPAQSKFLALLLLNIAYTIFEFLTNQDPKTAEGYLKFLDYTCGIILATNYFFKQLTLTHLQGNQEWLATWLLALFAFKYFLSRVSVTQELAIGRSLFPSDRVPDDLQMKDRKSIAIQVYGFMLLYVVLGHCSDRIILASLIMTGIAAGDFRTRDLINENMRQRFADKRYAPEPDDPECKSIVAKRKIAEWYLFALPHLCKELGVLFGSAAAFCIALYGFIEGRNLNMAAYFTLFATHVLNEFITVWWRIDRYVRLKAVKKEPEIFEGS